MPADAALAELQQLPGIGPFSAQLILLRGAGEPDFLSTAERRLHASMVELYGLAEADPAQLDKIADGWRPYRTWVSVLIRTYREDTTGEIAGK